jgi:5-methylcytosine-specific restriction endonuclease McrA
MLSLVDKTEEVARLGDLELIESLQRLLAQERGVHARLLIHLAEVEGRGLYRERAYSSMFDYCVQALHMSEAEAYLRIRAARLSREFPRVLEMLQAGELHLSSLKLLAPVLTADNAHELLEVARFKSKRELEVQLAARFEKPDVQNTIRKLPQAATSAPGADANVPLAFGTTAQAEGSAPCTPRVEPREEPGSLASASARPSLGPLGSGRYKLQLTASQALHDKLQQARDLMRHELPDGDLAQVVERALDLLIQERMKRRFGVGRKARTSDWKRTPKENSRHIPSAVRREVLARDGVRCTFVSSEGHRCAERGMLEFHHEEAFARGGPPTTSNIRMLCRKHNQWLAERDFGRRYIQERIEEAQHTRDRRQLVPELVTPGPLSAARQLVPDTPELVHRL